MQVGILALLHESNTFISSPTTLQHFQEHLLLCGEAIRQRLADTHHEIGGFFEGLQEAGLDAVPIFAARALPYGTITAECFDELLRRMMDELQRAGLLDGVLVAPHGATVSEAVRDADGHWLTEVRRRVGPRIPVIGTLDPHANLSPRMVAATSALIAYRTNPHLDQRTRGIEAATLMARTLRGEIHPTQFAAFPPVAINIERQLTSDSHLRPLYTLADRQLQRPGVLSNSIFLGFPYADVEEMGSSVLVVTNDAPDLARGCATELASYLWSHRNEFIGRLVCIEESMSICGKARHDPICLLDMGDNVGGGSPADSTHLAHALREWQLTEKAFICLYDPQSVEQARAAGVGAKLSLKVGGKTDHLHGDPFEDDFTVRGLYDGKFHESEPRHGGFTHCDQGPTAVVQGASGITVMLTSRRMPPFSIRQLTTFGVHPASFHVLVAKGVQAPVAAYQPVCHRLVRVNTPGCTTADMTTLNFQHRRRPMFPFEPGAMWGGS